MSTRREIELLLKLRDEVSAQAKKVEKALKGVESAQRGAQSATKRLSSELDSGLNRALQQAANQGGFATSALAKIGPVGLGVAAAIGVATLGFRELIQESARLTEEANKLGISTDEYQKRLGITIPLTEDAIEVGNRLSKKWNDLSTSAKNLALNIAALDSVGFAKDHPLFNLALRAGTFGLLGASAADAAAAAARGRPFGPNAGPQISPELLRQREREAKETEKATAALIRHNEEMAKIWARLNAEGIPTIMDLGNSLEDLGKPVTEVTGFLRDSALAAANLESNLAMFRAQASQQPFLSQASFTQAGLLARNELAANQAAAAIPKIVPLELKSSAEEAFQSLGGLSDELANLAHLSDILGPKLASVFQGLSTGIAGIQSIAGGFQRAGQGGFLNTLAGIGGIASGVGALAAPLVALIRGLGGPDIGRDVGRDIGAKISEELEKAIEESGENAQLFLSEIFGEGGLGIDRLAEEVGDLFSFLERGEITEKGLMGELNELLPILIENFGELGESGLAQIERLTGAAASMGIELGAAGDALERLAAGIPETTLESFAKSLGITTEQARELAETLGVNFQTDLERLADNLDIPVASLQELGAALQEQFGVGLEGIATILETTGQSISDLFASLGVTLPESLAAGLPGTTEAPLDPNATGEAMANHLMPGFRGLEDHLDRLGDKILLGIRDAIAQGG